MKGEMIRRIILPIHHERVYAKELITTDDLPFFSSRKLEHVAEGTKNMKVPRLDGNPAEFFDMYNQCFLEGVFVKKSKGPENSTSSYSAALCMLDTIDKLFKKLLQRAVVKAYPHSSMVSTEEDPPVLPGLMQLCGPAVHISPNQSAS